MTHTLNFTSVVDHPELVSESVFRSAQKLAIKDVMVAEIDPEYAGREELCMHYGVDPTMGANCIIVEAVHGAQTITAAVLVPVSRRADLNGAVRKALGARRVSLAPLERVLRETGMEYGSVTPFGLPDGWHVLLDESLVDKGSIIVGGGLRKSKLLLPVEILLAQNNTQALSLCKPSV